MSERVLGLAPSWALLIGILGCETCSAGVICRSTHTACDPETYVSRCVDTQTLDNCTRASQSMGCPSAYHVERFDCAAPNQCAMVEGFAECIAFPVELCALGEDDRCVEGIRQQCREPFYGEERYDIAHWVSAGECDRATEAQN